MIATPASSRARATARTSGDGVRVVRMAWEPSRRVESQTRDGGHAERLRTRERRLRQLLADAHGGRGHDVEVAGVGGQVVAGALHLDAAPSRGPSVEERLGAQPVARDVLRDAGDHLDDAGRRWRRWWRRRRPREMAQ